MSEKMNMHANLDIPEMLRSLRGKAPWGIRLGQGSFLTLEFGKPLQQSSSGRVSHGEWHLWLYMCNWRVELQNEVLVGSDDAREEIQKMLDSVNFAELEDVQLLFPSLDLILKFGDLKILTFSSSRNDENQWWLFTPQGKCLTIHGGGRYHYGNAHQGRMTV